MAFSPRWGGRPLSSPTEKTLPRLRVQKEGGGSSLFELGEGGGVEQTLSMRLDEGGRRVRDKRHYSHRSANGSEKSSWGV